MSFLLFFSGSMVSSFQKTGTFIIVYFFTILVANGITVTNDNLVLTATSGLTMTISGDFLNQNNGSIDNAGTITVSGDWTNNAANNVFSTNSGSVHLIGTSAQTIGGTNSTSFYDLTLNNSASSSTKYTLGANLTVKNALTLTAGNLNLATYTMTIGTSASSPGSLAVTAGSFYGGALKRWFGTSTIANGGSQGLFPMGTSVDNRYFFISAPAVGPTTGGTISVSHTDSAGNTAVSFTDINVTIDRVCNPYWTVTTGNGLADGTYNLRAEGTNIPGITDYTLLRLILSNGSVGINGTNAGSNTSPQVNRTGLTMAELTNTFHFGYPAAAALPIELLSFRARPVRSEVKINWVTATETNTDYFTVERSADGVMYEAVASVPGAGNSSINTYYNIYDSNPLAGLSFYRLRETDLDGTNVYFQPVSVHFDNISGEFEMTASHSSNDQIVVTILSSSQDDFVLDFYDSIGKLLYHHSGKLERGYQDFTIPLSNKAVGICMITARTPYNFISKRVF